jgi:hypothetical protein
VTQKKRQFKDFDSYKRERVQVEPLQFRFGGRDYSVPPQLSFVLTRMVVELDAELKTLDLNDPSGQMQVLDRCGQIIEQLVGAENWTQLLSDGFDAIDGLTFIEWISNEAALRQEPEEEGSDEEETVEPDPDAAPGEGGGEEQGKVSASPKTTSSPTGPPSSLTSSASAEYPQIPFSG